MRHLEADICMENEKKIIIELLPEAAPNTVNSFIWAAQQGIFDHHGIERIVPGDWIDVSYTGFGKKEGQYLIPYESRIHPELEPLPSSFGCVCMGGYGKLGQAGCEFFFPLRDCPEHRGIYPVFGKVLEGEEELLRLCEVETEPVTDYPDPAIKVNCPVEPQIIQKVKVRLGDYIPALPQILAGRELPECWKRVWKK